MGNAFDLRVKGICSAFMQMTQHQPVAIQVGEVQVNPQEFSKQQAHLALQHQQFNSSHGGSYPLRFTFSFDHDELTRKELLGEIREMLGRMGYDVHNSALPTDRPGVLESAEGIYLHQYDQEIVLEITQGPPVNYRAHWQVMGEQDPQLQMT